MGGSPATLKSDGTFVGYAQVPAGTTTQVHIVATDANNDVTHKHVSVTPAATGSTSLSFDLNGNETANGPSGAPTVTYGWDAADRLVTITEGSNVTKFDYDGNGKRVRESVNGNEMSHWIWFNDRIGEERDPTNVVARRFYSDGEQISGNRYFSFHDHLHSVREITDESSAVNHRYSYDPFGYQTEAAGFTGEQSDFGFTGHYVNRESRLYLTRNRAYDSVSGRWLSRDLFSDNATSPYAYVHNTPATRIDPYGLREVYVAIYSGSVITGNVGHAIITEMDGTTLLSQYPDPHGISGDNVVHQFPEVIANANSDPDVVFKVFVPNDTAFNAAVASCRKRKQWFFLPIFPSQTNCVRSAAFALRAGGVPVNDSLFPTPSDVLLPRNLAAQLKDLEQGFDLGAELINQLHQIFPSVHNTWSVSTVSNSSVPIHMTK